MLTVFVTSHPVAAELRRDAKTGNRVLRNLTESYEILQSLALRKTRGSLDPHQAAKVQLTSIATGKSTKRENTSESSIPFVWKETAHKLSADSRWCLASAVSRGSSSCIYLWLETLKSFLNLSAYQWHHQSIVSFMLSLSEPTWNIEAEQWARPSGAWHECGQKPVWTSSFNGASVQIKP